MADRRRTFGPVVLLGLAAAGLTAMAGNQPAAKVATDDVVTRGDAHMPLVSALGLVALATWGVVLVTRGRVRRAVACLGAVASAGALAAAVAGWSQVPDQLVDDLVLVGVQSPEIHHTFWAYLAFAGPVVALVASLVAVAWAPAWPEMGRRYDAPGAAAEALPEPGADPAEQTNLDLWKAMDEGRDPTA